MVEYVPQHDNHLWSIFKILSSQRFDRSYCGCNIDNVMTNATHKDPGEICKQWY